MTGAEHLTAMCNRVCASETALRMAGKRQEFHDYVVQIRSKWLQRLKLALPVGGHTNQLILRTQTMKRTLAMLLVALFSLAGISASKADVIGVDLAGDDYSVGGFAGWTLGYEFSLSQSASVTGLGFWDSGDGYAFTRIGLWDTAGTPLLSADTGGGSVVTFAAANNFGEWNFMDATTNLAPGSYVVGAWGDGLEFAADIGGSGTVLTAAFLTFTAPRYAIGTDFQFPSSTDVPLPGYFGGNIMFASEVPEPASMALFGLGMLGMVAIGAGEESELRNGSKTTSGFPTSGFAIVDFASLIFSPILFRRCDVNRACISSMVRPKYSATRRWATCGSSSSGFVT